MTDSDQPNDSANGPEPAAESKIKLQPRPTSITVIAWLSFVSVGLSLFPFMNNQNSPMAQEMMRRNLLPIPLQHLLQYADIPISLVIGIALLKGKNWARSLWVVYGIFGLIIFLVAWPIKAMVIPSLVFLAFLTFFLFRPKANAYFAGKEMIPEDASQSAGSLVLYGISILCFAFVGLTAFSIKLSLLEKLMFMVVPAVLAVLTLKSGLSKPRPINWKRLVGIVLIVSALLASAVVLFFSCLSMSQAYRELYPNDRTVVCSDYVTGILCVMSFILAGILFIKAKSNGPRN